MKFIGEVNILPSHAPLFANDHNHHSASEIFVRPHEFDILLEDDGNSSKAIVKRIIHLGWEIQAELLIADNWEITAHLNREKFDSLGLRQDQIVYVKPSRVKSFNNASVAA
jgi:sulfate transport system ATP-binding protein